MATSRAFEIPELFPRPRQIELDGGDSNLAQDVRLTTVNVLPIQRKAVRSILTAAGVRVVANKKTYVVDARVESPQDFDLKKIPEAARQDYYELKISGSEVFIRSPYQGGMVWAAQTLATIFRKLLSGQKLPNLTIRDWPALPLRGMFLAAQPGIDRMSVYEWSQLLDTMSALKLNALGVELYACESSCRRDGSDSLMEYLLFPIEGQETLHSERQLRWYSAKGDFWHHEQFPPLSSGEDFLTELVNYGKERGIEILPAFNFLGRNTLLPRLLPEISAKNAKGVPASYSFCLSSPATKSFLEETLGKLLDRYFPTGAAGFQVLLDTGDGYPDTVNPLLRESPWCSCSRCRRKSHAAIVSNLLQWLLPFLSGKNVGKLILDYQQLQACGLDTKALAALLGKLGLADKVVLRLGKTAENASALPGLIKEIDKLGLDCWLSPALCSPCCNGYRSSLEQVEELSRLAMTSRVQGLQGSDSLDFSHLDHLSLLSAYCWEPLSTLTQEKILARWNVSRFGGEAGTLQKAVAELSAAAGETGYNLCRFTEYYTITEGNRTWPMPFPIEMMSNLSHQKGALKSLEQAQKKADGAAKLLQKLLDKGGFSSEATETLHSLLADASQILAISSALLSIFQLQKTIEREGVHRPQAGICQSIASELRSHMKSFEEGKPNWMLPDSLQPLSALLFFLLQFEEDLKGVSNHKKGVELRWCIPEGWQVPKNL